MIKELNAVNPKEAQETIYRLHAAHLLINLRVVHLEVWARIVALEFRQPLLLCCHLIDVLKGFVVARISLEARLRLHS